MGLYQSCPLDLGNTWIQFLRGLGEIYGWVSREEGYKTQVALSRISNRHLTIHFTETT